MPSISLGLNIEYYEGILTSILTKNIDDVLVLDFTKDEYKAIQFKSAFVADFSKNIYLIEGQG